MLTAGLLEKYGITVPDGHICTEVHIRLSGKKGKAGILKTVTNGKQLEQNANKFHGTILKPVFVPKNENTEAI